MAAATPTWTISKKLIYQHFFLDIPFDNSILGGEMFEQEVLTVCMCSYKGCEKEGTGTAVAVDGSTVKLCEDHYRRLIQHEPVSCSFKVAREHTVPYNMECPVSDLAVMIADTENKLLSDWLFRYGYNLDDVRNKRCFIQGLSHPDKRSVTYYRLYDIDCKLLSTVEVTARVIKSEFIDTGATGGFVYECREIKENNKDATMSKM